ncbi:cytochrome P450 2B15-like isoform X2 [Dermacentor silvarum]|uniref:cytochrome P450 2B15-like isoform X2 n=1 Tax=Dermacentor silvarum TaxID=543639 RepID=UPI00189C370C|nr:cytochrome P450 2B15-like isoform X2 [Dermacentor silvarum]
MSALLERLALSSLWDWRWITTALVFAVSYFVGRFYHRVSKYPRGPFPLPLVGNLLSLRNVNLPTKAIEWSKVYGDVFTLWISHRPMVLLNSYNTIREASLDRRHEFAGRFSTKMGTLQTQGNHDIMFEDYNPRWKALRKVALLAVRKYAVSESLEKLCTEVVDDYVDSLKEGPQLVESREPFLHILYTLIGVSVYGTTVEEAKEDIELMKELDRKFYKIAPNGLPSDIAPWLGILYRRREKAVEHLFRDFIGTFDKLFSAAEATYAPGKTENFTHAMLSAREDAIREEKGDAEYLTKGNMVQVVLNIFGAATDTSAGELQCLFLMMAKEPWIQAKIQKEIEDTIGTTPPVYKDREKMPFTVACLMETLRCFPVAPLGLPHNTTTDTKVGKFEIPKDTGIFYNVYAVNIDPKLWDEPEKFRPERFLDPVTGKLRRDPFPLVSFGMGPRTCPGEKLAHVDMFYILVRLLQRLSVRADEKPPKLDISGLGSNIFLVPAEQNIVFTRRN